MNKRAFIYVRVSSHTQHNTPGNTSINHQMVKCQEYCDQQDLEVIDTLIEIRSARNKMSSQLLNRLLNDNILEEGDSLVFYNITRLSRNTVACLEFLDKLEKKGISVYSVFEKIGYQTTADRHLFRTTLSIAENESDQISDRVGAAWDARRAWIREQAINEWENEEMGRYTSLRELREARELISTGPIRTAAILRDQIDESSNSSNESESNSSNDSESEVPKKKVKREDIRQVRERSPVRSPSSGQPLRFKKDQKKK